MHSNPLVNSTHRRAIPICVKGIGKLNGKWESNYFGLETSSDFFRETFAV